MEDNPYCAFINSLRKDMDERMGNSFRLGTVKRTSPLTVETSGIELESGELSVNPDVTFERGDSVVLLPFSDNQKFILLCKVVDR